MPENIQKNNQSTGNKETQETAKASKSSKYSKKKEKKGKDLLSWKETWKVSLRALKLFYHYRPNMLWIHTFYTVYTALTPFVSIFLSARIIEELSGNRDPERLTVLVLFTLGLSALLSLISSLTRRHFKVEDQFLLWLERQIRADKMLSMDYALVDDTKIHEKLDTLEQYSSGSGRSLRRVIWFYDMILSGVVSLFGGFSLSVSLFTSKVPESAGGLTTLNNPLFIVLIIGLLLAVTYLSPLFVVKADAVWSKSANNHNLSNRLFGFYGFLGHRNEKAGDVRMYCQETLCEKYNKNKEGTFHSRGYYAKQARGTVGMYYVIASLFSVIFTGVVYLFVCSKAWAGAFGLGMVTQYISTISKLSGKVSSLFQVLGQARNHATFLKMNFDFLDIENTMVQGSLPLESLDGKDYEIEFQDVSFRYPGSEQYVLRHINMKFHAGQRLAVVGQNGSGKTTFIKLLCRLYDPTEGVILLDGVDIRKYDYQEYLSIFSVVFQDFGLTDFTLGQNVAAKECYDRSHVEDCLQKAGFEERLRELPLGTETYLSKNFSDEGVDMSGGEKQKIALARTLYKNAPFIILDEPTAALDPIAEAEIYGRFNEIIEDKTAIYISHRLSSCRFCDDILVFDKGAVVQHGSHDSLIQDGSGKYHELWFAQAQYYADN